MSEEDAYVSDDDYAYGGKDSDAEAPDDISAKSDTESDSTSEIEDDILDVADVSKYNREIIIVKPENRRTSQVLSKYEMTEIISIRSTQISQHSNCMVDITGLDDPIKMAKRELMARKCPLIVRRFVGCKKNVKTGVVEDYYEYWSPSEMQFSTVYPDVL